MSYDSIEQSVSSAQPVELYKFSHGIQHWRYCTGSAEISYNSEVYTPEAINRSEIKFVDSAFDQEVNIEVSRNNELAQQFIPAPLENKTTLIIYRGHGTGFITLWNGVIGAVTFDDRTAIIRCTPMTSSLKRVGLRRKYQVQCAYPLYSVGCSVNKESFKVQSTVASYLGMSITAGIFATKTDGWFVGGEFVCNDARRLILEHTGSTIVIASQIIGLSAGDSFTAYAGCDHSLTTCKTKFDNKLNYGGQPYIPTKNPFVGDSIL